MTHTIWTWTPDVGIRMHPHLFAETEHEAQEKAAPIFGPSVTADALACFFVAAGPGAFLVWKTEHWGEIYDFAQTEAGAAIRDMPSPPIGPRF